MKQSLPALAAVAMLYAVFPTRGFSNAAVPEPPPEVPFKITADKKTKENRLLIPRKFLEEGRVGSVGLPFGDDGRGFNLPTIIAGLAISISVVSLVYLIIRKKCHGTQVTLLMIAVGLSGLLWINRAKADLPPPTYDVVRQWSQGNKSDQNVTIEIVAEGDAVELILGTKYRGSGGQRPGPGDEPKPPGEGSPPRENGAKPE